MLTISALLGLLSILDPGGECRQTTNAGNCVANVTLSTTPCGQTTCVTRELVSGLLQNCTAGGAGAEECCSTTCYSHEYRRNCVNGACIIAEPPTVADSMPKTHACGAGCPPMG